jgi:MarR family transcriptional regulator, 2-MHQ and catechol-resistance regulon repressor
VPPDTASVDDRLVSTFGRLLEATHMLEHELGRALELETGLPLTWLEVLLRLSRSPGGELTMGEVARQLVVTSGGVTRLVDRMTAAGYVDRRRCEQDRRVQYARLTSLGRTVLAPALTRHTEHLRSAFEALSTAERHQLDALLDRLRVQRP